MKRILFTLISVKIKHAPDNELLKYEAQKPVQLQFSFLLIQKYKCSYPRDMGYSNCKAFIEKQFLFVRPMHMNVAHYILDVSNVSPSLKKTVKIMCSQ